VDAPERMGLCGCTTYSGRLSYAQILEAADSIGVTRFLCRILDMDFREFPTGEVRRIPLLRAWVNNPSGWNVTEGVDVTWVQID
jgi:hypothetical protein